MKTLVSLALLALSLPAAARIGETSEQLVARYGKAWHVKGIDMMIFFHDGLYISATLWNGTCHSISFSTDGRRLAMLTKDQEHLPTTDRKEFSDWQARDLMENCRAGSVWLMLADQEQSFITKDDRQEASIWNNQLTIRSSALRKHLEAKSAAAQERALAPYIVHEKPSIPTISRSIYFSVFMPEDAANP